jgi:hypothetical protein
MAQTVQAGTAAPTERPARIQHAEVSGWVGFIAFAGVMMVLIGAMQALYGLVAVVNDDWVVFTNNDVLLINLRAWGWVHLAAGALVLLVGIGVLLGSQLARWAGIVVVGLSMIGTFLSLPAYPVWGLVILAVDALIIYALIAHGREIRLP